MLVFFMQSVWKILDGIGDAIDGTVDEISDFLYRRILLQDKKEVRTSLDFNYVKPCLDLIKLQPQILTL